MCGNQDRAITAKTQKLLENQMKLIYRKIEIGSKLSLHIFELLPWNRRPETSPLTAQELKRGLSAETGGEGVDSARTWQPLKSEIWVTTQPSLAFMASWGSSANFAANP